MWASRREAQSLLPVLARRLVFGTGRELQRVGFPAHESVQLGGWDGIVVAGEGDSFVPPGASAWELSVEDDVGAKANADYRKRTADPKGITPLESTFVFLTPRRWKGKGGWIQSRTAEGKWGDVRAYDADDLEQWVERSPSTLSWLAEQLGLRFDDVWELGSHWRDWTASTRPPFSLELLLAGRESAVKTIVGWLASGRPTLAVVAESTQERVQRQRLARRFHSPREQISGMMPPPPWIPFVLHPAPPGYIYWFPSVLRGHQLNTHLSWQHYCSIDA